MPRHTSQCILHCVRPYTFMGEAYSPPNVTLTALYIEGMLRSFLQTLVLQCRWCGLHVAQAVDADGILADVHNLQGWAEASRVDQDRHVQCRCTAVFDVVLLQQCALQARQAARQQR